VAQRSSDGVDEDIGDQTVVIKQQLAARSDDVASAAVAARIFKRLITELISHTLQSTTTTVNCSTNRYS